MSLDLSIVSLEKYKKDPTLQMSSWTRLVWPTEGGEVTFIRSGLADEREHFEGAGWALVFNQSFLTGFLERYAHHYHSCLMKERAFDPIKISLTPALKTEFNDLAISLSHAQIKGKTELYLQAYADLILLNANDVYAKETLIEK